MKWIADVSPFKKYDAPLTDKIDIFQISHAPFTSEEEAERAETLGMVHDPEWLAKGKEAQEGELVAVHLEPFRLTHSMFITPQPRRKQRQTYSGMAPMQMERGMKIWYLHLVRMVFTRTIWMRIEGTCASATSRPEVAAISLSDVSAAKLQRCKPP